MNKFLKFLYQLFFTRNDDLDTLQVLFTVIVIVSLQVVWYITTNKTVSDGVRVEALVTLRWMLGLLVLTAVPKWMVPHMAQMLSGKFSVDEPQKQPDPALTGDSQ